ncbi:MAG: glycosyltransferase family 2 protein [Bacteroides sp.]|nr:glycosyltransferase family 2 protein [Bacteroides sp.]
MQPLISVIIPCYNSQPYIETCVNSLKVQGLSNWEAIFVNDGSKDGSLRVLEAYAAQDFRIKVYSQINQGAAKAREYGISKATGNYIMFLDVDDTLDSGAFELIKNEIEKNEDADIFVACFNILKDNKLLKRTRIFFNELGKISYLKKVLTGRCGWELCGKIYRKELFDDSIKTPVDIRIGEDAAIFIQIVSKAERIKGINYPIYNYIQYSQSASHIRNKKYAEETLRAGIFIEDYLSKQPFYCQIKDEISAMFLLLYSNSSFKWPLSRKNNLVESIKKNHLRILPIFKIHILKSIYVLALYVTNGKITNYISKVK